MKVQHSSPLRATLTALALLVSADTVLAFEPIEVGIPGVPYPPSPVALPTESEYTDTEDSPRLQMGRVLKKLHEAQAHERAGATDELRKDWSRAKATTGARSKGARRAEARWLRAYFEELQAAAALYGTAVDMLNEISPEPGDDEESDPLKQQMTQAVESYERESKALDAACHIDPESCVQPDGDNQRLLDELRGLLETQLPDGEGFDLVSLKQKTRLLHLRTLAMMRQVQVAAGQVVTDEATPTDSSGRIKPLPSPLPEGRRRGMPNAYSPGDPYE